MVPRNDKALVPTSPARGRRLRQHLGIVLARTGDNETTSPVRRAREGFAGRIALTACSLCRGSCCRNGGDDAYLDEQTLARACRARPEMATDTVLQLYVDRVPE